VNPPQHSEDLWGSSAAEEDTISAPAFLLDPMGTLRRRWALIALIASIGITATLAVQSLWQPTYIAAATVLITSQQIPEEFVRPTVREDTISNINAMIGKVLSQDNLSRLIEELGLFADVPPSVPSIDLVNRMRARVESAPLSTRNRYSTALVYGISYESEYPQEAALVANALAELFVDASKERRNAQARRTTEFLREELGRDEAELRDLAAQISEFRRQHRGTLPSELDTNLRKLDQLASRRTSVLDQISQKRTHVETLRSQPGTAVQSENGALLEELRRQLARESAIHTDEHPNVMALKSRIARLEELLGAGPDRYLDSGVRDAVALERREIGRLQGELARIDGETRRINSLVDRTPAVAEEMAALEQKHSVLREDYLDSLRKVEEAELAESLESAEQGGQVAILDQALTPTSPIVSRSKVLLAGFGISLGLAFGLAILLELVDPVVASSKQLETLSGRQLLGSLPRIA